MRVTFPFEITEAMLTGSSAPEVPPAAHVMGTTYAKDVTASTGNVGGVITVWKSLQAANTGRAPATSPAWWLNIGTTYSVYDTNHTYALGERVIDPVAHLVYESRISGANLGQPLATGTAWLKIGPTNRWASFDQLRNTQTVAPVDIVQSITLTNRASSIAVIGLDGRSVTIKQTVGGIEKYSATTNLSKRKSRRWKEYFFGEFTSRTSVQFFDLPPYRNSTITVTVSKPLAGQQRGVGGIVIGNAVYIGDVQYEAKSDHLNFSDIERDKFGNLTLDPERSVPKVDLEVWFDKSLTSRLLALREQTNGRPAIWSGLDDFTLDYFEPLFLYAIPREFSLNLKEFEFGVATLQLEEM